MAEWGLPRLLELLTPEETALVVAAATRRKYRDGEIVHERGDDGPTIGVIVAGKIKLVYPSRDGHEIFSGLIHTGQNYGDAAHIHGSARAHRAVAVGETVIDHLDAAGLARLLQDPGIARALYRVASYRLSVALDMLDDMRLLRPVARLAKLILRMHRASGALRLEYLQEDFASILGVSSVTLAKSLRQLEEQGVIETGYRHIRLKDPAGLEAWVRDEVPD